MAKGSNNRDIAAQGNKRLTDKVQRQQQTIPSPPPPPGDPAWIKKEQKAGTIPDPVKHPRKHSLLQMSLTNEPALDRHRAKMEDELSQEDWETVYKQFAITGKTTEIAKTTGIPPGKVKHLIDYGLSRLGLPSIREHATEKAKVNLAATDNSDSPMLNLPHIQDAITKRAARECAGAQAVLQTIMDTADVFAGLTAGLVDMVRQRGIEAYDMPEQITPALLEKVAKVGNALTNALDTAVQVSRRTAGEPERHLSMEVAILVGRMTDDELKGYFETGRPPRRLLSSGGSAMVLGEDDQGAIDADFAPIEGFDD